MFFTRQKVKPTYEERLTELEVTVSKLKREVLGLVMDVETIRSKVLRKIQRRKNENEKDLNPTPINDGLDDLRSITCKSNKDDD